MKRGHLHILAGKIAAGKTTLATKLSGEPDTVLLSEDSWLSGLFGPEMNSIKDYVRYSSRLRFVIAPHVEALLERGLNVVLDFPANTRETRRWIRQIVDQTGAPHTLHFLNVPDDVCRARLKARNLDGLHEFSVSDQQFEAICQHFEPPSLTEGFDVVEHKADD